MGTSLYEQFQHEQAGPKKPVGSLYDQFRAEQPAPQPAGHDIHAQYRSGELAKRMSRENANDQEAVDADGPSYAQQALGGIASLARDIPGAEALQAGARALTRGQSYGEARNDIRSAEESAPSVVRNANRVIGGVVGAAALPGSPVVQGATYGAAGGLLQSDPDAGVGTRAKDAAIGGTVGAVAGKLGDAGTNLGRIVAAKTLGRQALVRKAAMQAADKVAYGAAEAEAAAAGGTSPAIQSALEQPDIKPFADVIRQSRTHAGSDDATVLREAYKLMSERQGSLASRMVNANDFKAGTSLEKADITGAKQELLNAAEAPTPTGRPAVQTAQSPAPSLRDALANFRDRQTAAYTRNAGTTEQQMARRALERHSAEDVVSPALQGAPPEEILPGAMPSLRGAVEQHAKMAGERDAFRAGSDATRRVLGGSKVAGKKLETNSPEAFLSSILGMTPEEAQSALEGTLGRAKEYVGGSANPIKGFGLGPSLQHAAKISPFVQKLEDQAGGAPPLIDLLRAVVGSQGHPTP